MICLWDPVGTEPVLDRLVDNLQQEMTIFSQLKNGDRSAATLGDVKSRPIAPWSTRLRQHGAERILLLEVLVKLTLSG